MYNYPKDFYKFQKQKTYNMFFFLIFSAGFLAVGKSCSASTYYIDYISGSAANSGTSTSAPWKYAPGDSRFLGTCSGDCATTWVASGSHLVAGDKVIFRGDVTYSGSAITTTWGGTADDDAHRIIYDGDSGTYVPRWGEGVTKAKIDCLESYEGFLNTSNGDYVTINNFEITNGKKSRSDFGGGVLIFNYADASHVTISNNNIHGVGDFAKNGGTQTGTGIGSDGSDYFKVIDNLVYDCGYTGIQFFATSNSGSHLEIARNTVTDKVAWAINCIIAMNYDLTDWNIYDNVVYDLYYYDETADVHNNYIWLFGGGNGKVDGISIYNNQLYTDGVAVPSSGAIHLEAPDNGFNDLRIYNNIMKNIKYTGGAIYLTTNNNDTGGSFDGVYIYNNSITTHAGTDDGALILSCGASGSYSNVNIKNNIFNILGSSGHAILIGDSVGNISGLSIDYNIYNLANSLGFQWGGAGMNWPNFKVATGNMEIHSQGADTDPLFSDVGVNSHDLTLQIGSPAINSGTDLSAIAGTVDLEGNIRSGIWDIGAYEYVEASALQADFDSDSDVDIFDYNILLANFGTTGDCENPADTDADCDVDIFDYNVLLAEFGSGI